MCVNVCMYVCVLPAEHRVRICVDGLRLQVDVNGDGSLEWEEFTSYIVEAGLSQHAGEVCAWACVSVRAATSSVLCT
jgi:hypothetical protein